MSYPRNQRITPIEQVATFIGLTLFISIATMALLALVYVPVYMIVTRLLN